MIENPFKDELGGGAHMARLPVGKAGSKRFLRPTLCWPLVEIQVARWRGRITIRAGGIYYSPTITDGIQEVFQKSILPPAGLSGQTGWSLRRMKD
jgi:hypothetical protein